MGQDISKLPKWAQDRLRNLQGEVERVREEMLTLTGKPGSTNIEWRHALEHHPLPPGVTVRFTMDEYRWVEIGHFLGGVQIRGSRQLIIVPNVSNTFKVDEER